MGSIQQMVDWTRDEVVAAAAARLLEVWQRHIPVGADVALLDFPDHSNVGDSAIWAGELIGLSLLGCQIRYAACHRSFSERVLRNFLPAGGVILIHGGGNFGTLWPECHAHRELVLERFRDHKVVQLPQSLHFGDEAALQRCRALVQAHPDFTLLVRDTPSLRLATEGLGARAELCPDAALLLAGHLKRAPATTDVFVLARTDKERSVDGLEAALSEQGLCHEIGDWLDDGPLTSWRWLSRRVWPRAMGRLTRLPGFFPILQEVWRRVADERVQRGVGQLCRGRVVITDRLHAHILCSLLGIPHVVLDNSYGKLGGFIDAWMAGSPLVRRARTPSEAVALAKELLTHGPSGSSAAPGA